MRSSVCMASYSWLGAVDSSTSLPEWRSSSSSGTDTSSSSQTFSRVLTGGTTYMYSLLNCIILRLVAILYPLKYHVYASCRAGKIICIITIFLTGLLTLLSNIFILSRTYVYSAFEGFLAGVIPAHIGEKAMDHFLLVSSKKFVMSLTLPFTVLLVS